MISVSYSNIETNNDTSIVNKLDSCTLNYNKQATSKLNVNNSSISENRYGSNNAIVKSVISGVLVLTALVNPVKASSYSNSDLHVCNVSGIQGLNFGDNTYTNSKGKKVITMEDRVKKVTPIKLIVKKVANQQREIIHDDLYEEDRLISNKNTECKTRKILLKLQ